MLGRPLAGPQEAPAAASALARMGAGNVVITLGAAGAVLARAPDTAGPEMAGAPDAPGPDVAGAPGAPGPDVAGAPGATGAVTVPGFSVASVDSVGAGDAFVAALAVALAAGVGAADAVRTACAAGAAATTRRGAQAALPRPADVLAATGAPWPLAGQ